MKKDCSWHVRSVRDEHKKLKESYLISGHEEMKKIGKIMKTL